MISALAMVVLLSSSAPPALRCKGEGAKDAKTQQARKTIEGMELFKFAVKQLGAPKSCAVKWTREDGGDFSTVTYVLEKGTATFANLPPETGIHTLEAKDGFPDEAAVRAFFKSAEPMKSFSIDWAAKPEVATEKGATTETYWSTGEGDNAGVDLTTRGGKLVKASFHFAL